jgi:hypothetical protein
MQALANSEIGGFFDVVQEGSGASKAKIIIGLVRARFNAMWLIRWTMSCVNPSVEQSFNLVFENTHPMIAPDGSFRRVSLGMDPSQWPLDVDVEKTTKAAQDSPLYPGGQFTVYGDFCWSGDKQRAEAYFVPAGTKPATSPAGGSDPEATKQAVQLLQSEQLLGPVIATGEGYATFNVPNDEKVLDGPADNKVARVVIYDNRAHRASAIEPTSVLTLRATKRPLPLALVAGIAGLVVVVVLLVIVLSRSRGGARSRGGRIPRAPASASYDTPAGAADPFAATAAVGAARTPPGLFAMGMPARAPASFPPSHEPSVTAAATIRGAAGQFAVRGGYEVHVGRDPAQCPIFLSEPRVSAVHATLKFEGGHLMVRDEGSNNGTWVSGARVSPGVWTSVPPGQSLRFGPVEFTVEVEE